MRLQMIPDTHLLKLLFLARYYLSLSLHSIYISFIQKFTFLLYKIYLSSKTSHKLQSAPIHISMNQGAFYILTDEALTKSLL